MHRGKNMLMTQRPSTGMGIAHVQKTVERVGHRFSAIGNPIRQAFRSQNIQMAPYTGLLKVIASSFP